LKFISVDKDDYSTTVQCEKFFQADLRFQDLPITDNHVDAVFCSHVVEHLTKHEHLLSEIRRVLKPTGSVYIEVPSIRSLLVPSFWGHGNTLNFYDDPGHIRPYTREALYRMGRTIGLKEIKTGVARNWLYCLLALALLTYAICKRDRKIIAVTLWSITGCCVYLWGKNIDK